MTTLEQLAVRAWRGWGEYAKHTTCTRCGSSTYCRARRQRGPWLCVSCHDLGGGR
jgi:hypothetical protein